MKFVHRIYGPVLKKILTVRYIFITVLIVMLIVIVAYVQSGRVRLIV